MVTNCLRATAAAVATMPFPILSGDAFEQLGFSIIGHACNGSKRIRERRFITHFGLKPELVSIVWRELQISGWLQFSGRCPKPEHLLWCLLFLNNYSVEEINAGIAGVSERTFRDRSWFYAQGIANLDTKFVR